MTTILRVWIGRILVTAIAAGALLISGCSSDTPRGVQAPSAEAVAAELSQLSGSTDGAAPKGSGPSQRSSGGSVTIDVTWNNPKDTAALTFAVAMDTHSVELDGYDLAKLTLLRNDRGQEVKPSVWDAPPGGHHRTGTLAFPAKDASGKPLVAPGVKTLEMVIRDVSGVKERVLKWEVKP